MDEVNERAVDVADVAVVDVAEAHGPRDVLEDPLVAADRRERGAVGRVATQKSGTTARTSGGTRSRIIREAVFGAQSQAGEGRFAQGDPLASGRRQDGSASRSVRVIGAPGSAGAGGSAAGRSASDMHFRPYLRSIAPTMRRAPRRTAAGGWGASPKWHASRFPPVRGRPTSVASPTKVRGSAATPAYRRIDRVDRVAGEREESFDLPGQEVRSGRCVHRDRLDRRALRRLRRRCESGAGFLIGTNDGGRQLRFGGGRRRGLHEQLVRRLEQRRRGAGGAGRAAGQSGDPGARALGGPSEVDRQERLGPRVLRRRTSPTAWGTSSTTFSA